MKEQERLRMRSRHCVLSAKPVQMRGLFSCSRNQRNASKDATVTDEWNDEAYMRRAIELAKTAAGWTNPNPLVGAVIVKDGRIIGEGCHEHFGQAHAERNALASCTESPTGATLYVTLEPCSHTGHQPPCANALIEAGVARVVVGSRDPNPLVSGRGNQRLRNAGISVETDVLRDECDAINPLFFHYIVDKRPYVVAKWAMTADGKIATAQHDARWVSNEQSRAWVHELRHRLSAIMVGVNTLLADDPLLTARRSQPSRNPLRVVCDSHLRTPPDCALVRTAHEVPTVIACALPIDAQATDEERALSEAGVEVWRVPDAHGRVDLEALLARLGQNDVDSVLLEGGSTLMSSAFEAGLVDEALAFIAPKVVGGSSAPGPLGGAGIPKMADALSLGTPRVATFGDDVCIAYAKEGAPLCLPE